MELKMNEYQLPDRILFNYEELKQELTDKVSMYETGLTGSMDLNSVSMTMMPTRQTY